MIVGIGLALGALVLGGVGPRWLDKTARPSVHPTIGLTAWVTSLVALLASMLGAGLLMVLPDPTAPDGAVGLARICVESLLRGEALPWLHAARLVVGTTLLGIVLRVAVHAVRIVARERQRIAEHRDALLAVARPRDDVWWVESSHPMAFSLGGRPGHVFATDGVRALPDDQCAAVIAHERAHIEGRHRLLALLARSVGEALPRVALARAAAVAVPVMLELCADSASARRCGHRAIADALAAVPEHPPRLPGLGIGERTHARQAWLEHRHDRGRWTSGRAVRAAVTTITTAPVLAAPGLTILLAVVACT